MKNLFIIGAGFSHAIAGLPLGKDLANIIYKNVLIDMGENNWLTELASDYLQYQIKPFISDLESDGTKIQKIKNNGANYPIDGYGFSKIYENNIVLSYNYPETKIELIKLHGSVNWVNESFMNFDDKVSIVLNNYKEVLDGLEVK